MHIATFASTYILHIFIFVHSNDTAWESLEVERGGGLLFMWSVKLQAVTEVWGFLTFELYNFKRPGSKLGSALSSLQVFSQDDQGLDCMIDQEWNIQAGFVLKCNTIFTIDTWEVKNRCTSDLDEMHCCTLQVIEKCYNAMCTNANHSSVIGWYRIETGQLPNDLHVLL